MRVISDRFHVKVARGAPDECWTWLSTRIQTGYGQFWLNGRYVPATHVAYELHFGERPPPGMLVCHTCDNPPCVNPHHLFIATPRENMEDKFVKGRANTARGERKLRSSKLTTNQVIRVKELLREGRTPQALAKEFGVTPGAIYHIRRGSTWAHV